jgi:hypothetical protein
MKTWHQPYICPFPQPNISCYPHPSSLLFILQHPAKISHNYKIVTKRSLYSFVYILPLSLTLVWLTHDLKFFIPASGTDGSSKTTRMTTHLLHIYILKKTSMKTETTRCRRAAANLTIYPITMYRSLVSCTPH